MSEEDERRDTPDEPRLIKRRPLLISHGHFARRTDYGAFAASSGGSRDEINNVSCTLRFRQSCFFFLSSLLGSLFRRCRSRFSKLISTSRLATRSVVVVPTSRGATSQSSLNTVKCQLSAVCRNTDVTSESRMMRGKKERRGAGGKGNHQRCSHEKLTNLSCSK